MYCFAGLCGYFSDRILLLLFTGCGSEVVKTDWKGELKNTVLTLIKAVTGGPGQCRHLYINVVTVRYRSNAPSFLTVGGGGGGSIYIYIYRLPLSSTCDKTN